MGNSGSRNANNVPEQYTRPAGLYTGQNGHALSNAELRRLRRSILDGKMSPCYPGADEGSAELEECPICFLHYPCLNRSKCCQASICTECFLEIKQQQQQALAQQHQNTNAVVNSNNLNQCCPFCKKTGYAVYFTGRKSKEERAKELAEEQRVIEAQIRARQEEDRIACENAERRRNSRNASASEDGGSEATGRSVDRTDGGGARSRTDNQRQAVDEPPPYRNEELVRMEEQQRRFEEEQLQRYSSARRQRWVQQQRLFQQQLQHQHRQATIQQQQRGLLAQQLSAAGVRDEMAGVGGRGGDGGMGGADPDTGRSTRSTSRGGHGAVRRDPENDTRRDARGHGIGDDEDAARLASSGDEPVAVANVRDFIPDHLLSESASTATAEMFGVEPGMSIDLEDIMLLEAIWQSLHDTNSNNTTVNDADANDASADERNDDETTDETTNVNAVGDATIISSANVASGVRAADDDSDAAVRAQSNEDGDVDAARDEAITASHIEQADGNDGAGNNREDTGRPPMDSVDELNDAMISDGGVCATEEEEATHAINIAAASESPPPDAGIAHLTELESVQNLESDIEQMLAGIVDTSTNTTTAVVAPDPTFDAPETLPSVSRSIENEEVLCAFEDRATREDNEEESQSDVTATLVRNIMNTIIERATPDDMTIHEQQGETNEEAHTM